MNSLTIRTKRRSRGSDTLLEAANRILRLLGVNTTKRVKQPSTEKLSARPLSPVRSLIVQAESRTPSPGRDTPPPALTPPPPLAAPPSPAVSSASSSISQAETKISQAQTKISQAETKISRSSPAAESDIPRPLPEPSSSPDAQRHSQKAMMSATKRTAKDFIFGKIIGEGCFSTVILAKDIHTSKEYAIKVCEKRHIIREKKVQYIQREKDVLNKLFNCRHGFVRLYQTFQDAEKLYFVLSYAKNGELLPYINKVGSFDLEATRFYAAELVVALEQMHAMGIVHRDLKPENILLDERMHMLVTDFGSSKILAPEDDGGRLAAGEGRSDDENDELERRRRMSFVGTAQYVSPELLTDKSASCASDLWALGCIVYQMVSGEPPFRAGSEYLIFQKIIHLEYEFPEGFPAAAKDLVEKLLVLEPSRRLGAQDGGAAYESIRNHPMFEGIEWDTLYEQQPPPLYPYLPGLHAPGYRVPDHLEPGLGDSQMARLLELELADSLSPLEARSKGILNISPKEKASRLEQQRLESRWHRFANGELILKAGLVDKRKGLFARRRMLLLTTGPHLYYVDPVAMVLKGEIPFSSMLRAEPKNFRIFFVHTPNRTYYLEDPESYALEWCRVIEEVRLASYPQDAT